MRRVLAKRHRWPRSRSNDSETLVQVDLTEISHFPIARQPQGQAGHQEVTALKQKIEALQAELLEMKAVAHGHRPDFERERTNKLLAELLKATSESTGAREKAALLEGKLSMLTQPWRRRLVDAFSLALPQVACTTRERRLNRLACSTRLFSITPMESG